MLTENVGVVSNSKLQVTPPIKSDMSLTRLYRHRTSKFKLMDSVFAPTKSYTLFSVALLFLHRELDHH